MEQTTGSILSFLNRRDHSRELVMAGVDGSNRRRTSASSSVLAKVSAPSLKRASPAAKWRWASASGSGGNF